MKQDDVQQLLNNPENYRGGMFYCCAQDPRVVVPRLRMPGWTINFAHPWAFPVLLLFVVVAVSPFIALLLLWRRASPVWGKIAVVASIGGVCFLAMALSTPPAKR